MYGGSHIQSVCGTTVKVARLHLAGSTGCTELQLKYTYGTFRGTELQDSNTLFALSAEVINNVRNSSQKSSATYPGSQGRMDLQNVKFNF
jgi:hypothetical protein